MKRRQFTYLYQGKPIDYSVWFTSNDKTMNTIVFLGTVQIDKLPEWVARACPPGTAIVQGAPYWHTKPDGSDIPDFMIGYTKSALKEIAAHHTISSLNVLADSQAVPAVIRIFTLKQYAPTLKSLVLLQPLGLNPNAFRGTENERIAILKRRVARNAYHQIPSLVFDSRLRYNHRLLNKVASLRNPRVKAQYSSGLEHSALPDLKKLTELGAKVTIVCGAKDKMFPADEIESSLKQEGIAIPMVSVRSVPHSPLATKQGLKLLNAAFSNLLK